MLRWLSKLGAWAGSKLRGEPPPVIPEGPPLDPEVLRRVIKCVAEEMGIEDTADITAETSTDMLGVDSLDRLVIVMAVEDEFGIALNEDGDEEFRSIRDLVEIVLERQNPLSEF